MSNPDKQTNIPLSEEEKKALGTEIPRIPPEMRPLLRIAIGSGDRGAAANVIQAIMDFKKGKEQAAEQKKEESKAGKELKDKQKADREKKEAFDSLSVQVDKKLQETKNPNKFNEASEIVNRAIGKGKKLGEGDVSSLRTRISTERNDAKVQEEREKENEEKEKARTESGKLVSIVSTAISNAESKVRGVTPAENVDISSAVDDLNNAGKEIDRVSDIKYVDQSVIAGERARISEARERLNDMKKEKQGEYVEAQQRTLVDTVKTSVESSKTKMAADPVGARSDLVVANTEITRVEKIRGINSALVSEQRRLVEDQEKKIAEKEREIIVNNIINTHILAAAPNYDAAKTAADTELSAGRINEADRKKIIDLIDSERSNRISPEAERIRTEMSLPANAKESELIRLEDEALAAYGNKQITQAEFNALNLEIQARKSVIAGRESGEKTKKDQEKADKNKVMRENLRRGDLLPGGASYNLSAFDAEVAGRVGSGELTATEGEDLKRQARQDYQAEEDRIKADPNNKRILGEIRTKFEFSTPVSTTFNIDRELANYPTLTEREKKYISSQFSEAVSMGIQAERDKGADMTDVVSKLQDEIDNFQGSPEVKAALQKKFEAAEQMLYGTSGKGYAEKISEAKINLAKAERFSLAVKELGIILKYTGLPALFLTAGLTGGGMMLLGGSGALASVLGVGGGGLFLATSGASAFKYWGLGGRADMAKVNVEFLEREKNILKLKSELQDVAIKQGEERAKFFAERYAAKHGIDPSKMEEVIKIWQSRFGLERTKELSDALNGLAQLTK